MGLTRIRADQISDIDYKQAVRVVSLSNVTLTGSAPATVDGVSLAVNDRILVAGQSTGSQNGLYYVQTVGNGSTGTWVRSSDGNASGEIESGMIVMVTEGTTYTDTQWKLTTDNPITLGVTALTFVQNYSANSISAGTSNVVVNSNANVTVSSAGTANVLVVTGTGANIAGTLSASGNITGSYFLGNGSQLSGIITTVSANTLTGNTLSSNVVNSSLTSVGTLGSLSVTGNVSSGNLNVTGNLVDTGALSIITGSSGNISLAPNGTNVLVATTTGANIAGTLNATGNANVGNLGATNIVGTLTTAAQTNITSVGTLGSLSVTGNITGNYILGNGSQLTGISAGGGTSITNGTSNVAVAASSNVTVGVAGTPNVATFTTVGIIANSVATTNNGGAFNFKVGDDAWIGDINTADTIGIRGQQNNANGYIVFGNADATTKLGRAGSGPLTYDSAFSATGNVTGGNLLTSGNIVDTGAMSIITGASGNVSLAPNGTNVLVATTTGANITGTLNATGNANVGNLGATNIVGTLTTAAQTNITSVGTLSSLSVTGNITGGNILGGANVNATTHTGTTVSVTGNITGGNLLINTNAVITGNLSVLGTETIFNVANLTVNDKDIIVANNVTGGANVNGAGIQAGNPAVATWFFNNATTSWQSNVAMYTHCQRHIALGGTSNYWGSAYVTTLTATGNANVGNLGATTVTATTLTGTLSTASTD
jgi:hypothetical protein